jgi:hypothetical protein
MMQWEHCLPKSGDLATASLRLQGLAPHITLSYDGLKDFEYDLHQRIHLQNNIVFPRAIELEASGA